MADSSVTIVILAAGSGSRMRDVATGVSVEGERLSALGGVKRGDELDGVEGGGLGSCPEREQELPKQFAMLCGRPILIHTIFRFIEALPDADIVVVVPSAYLDHWRGLAVEFDLTNRCRVCVGGDSRFESVKAALEIEGVAESEFIGVHDGVRPLVSEQLIRTLLSHAQRWGNALPAVEPVDSFRVIVERMGQGEIAESRVLPRSELRAIQTPQFFRGDILVNAYRSVYTPLFTDDASVVERSGVKIRLCEGERENIKITTPFDMAVAEMVLSRGKARTR